MKQSKISKLLYWITGFLPVRYINDGNTPYLERYYLFTLFGWQFYIHQFVGSDPDRGLHDHPWSLAFSIILSGWYYEETRSGPRKVRWFNWLTGDSFHRVVLPYSLPPGNNLLPCWTLFFHRAEKVKKWGFLKSLKLPNGAEIFTPYSYSQEGNQDNWWLTAPTRRELAS